jgi:hypothetical protein
VRLFGQIPVYCERLLTNGGRRTAALRESYSDTFRWCFCEWSGAARAGARPLRHGLFGQMPVTVAVTQQRYSDKFR